MTGDQSLKYINNHKNIISNHLLKTLSQPSRGEGLCSKANIGPNVSGIYIRSSKK
jgi:hypothetical protein